MNLPPSEPPSRASTEAAPLSPGVFRDVAANAPPPAQGATKGATRGVAVITAAKAYFLLTGFAQPLILTRLLGTEGYGLYGVVLNVVSILNNVVVAGSIQAMSRAVTEDGAQAVRRGLILHAALGLTLAGGLVALAGPLGAGALHDPRLPTLLRVGAIVVGDYSVYAALVGALNGRRRFMAQAGLDMTFATLRTGLVLGLASTSLRVTGAVMGFAAASAVILGIALVLVLPMLRGGMQSSAAGAGRTFGGFARHYARFFAPVLLYQLALNLVLQVDLLVMKALLSRHGRGLEIDTLAGIYKAVQNFAFLPYQLLLAVTFVVFPVVSQSTLEGDRETTRRFVHNALRFSALALGAMLAVLSGLSAGVMRLAYKPEYLPGAPSLRVLSLAQGAFALSVIGTTIVLAAGRTAAATGLMAVMLAAVLAGDITGLTVSPDGTAALYGTALGTAAGCAVGLVAVGVYMHRVFGGFLSLGTAVRVAGCALAAGVAGAYLPLHGKVGTLVAAAVVAVLYAVGLVVTQEVTAAERQTVLRRVRRR